MRNRKLYITKQKHKMEKKEKKKKRSQSCVSTKRKASMAKIVFDSWKWKK